MEWNLGNVIRSRRRPTPLRHFFLAALDSLKLNYKITTSRVRSRLVCSRHFSRQSKGKAKRWDRINRNEMPSWKIISNVTVYCRLDFFFLSPLCSRWMVGCVAAAEAKKKENLLHKSRLVAVILLPFSCRCLNLLKEKADAGRKRARSSSCWTVIQVALVRVCSSQRCCITTLGHVISNKSSSSSSTLENWRETNLFRTIWEPGPSRSPGRSRSSKSAGWFVHIEPITANNVLQCISVLQSIAFYSQRLGEERRSRWIVNCLFIRVGVLWLLCLVSFFLVKWWIAPAAQAAHLSPL